MSGLEITLIIIGIIFLIGSFMVKDKLSSKDIDKIAELSEEELKILVQKQIQNAKNNIDDAIETEIADAKETTKRELEKATNEKIMAINEYSDTVLDQINKSHNEIMFLYSMLNDKHKDLTDLAGKLQKFTDKMNKEVDGNMMVRNTSLLQKQNISSNTVSRPVNAGVTAQSMMAQKERVSVRQNSKSVNDMPKKAAEVSRKAAVSSNKVDMDNNHNRDILLLHKKGINDVEIAKKLGLGIGEVKLVIGLFEGEIRNEA